MDYIKLDYVTYKVRVVYKSRVRSFEVREGQNAGVALNDRSIRDIKGTAYSWQMQIEPDPENWADYNAFYLAISSPKNYHLIEVPFGDGTWQFQAKILSGQDTDCGIIGGHRRYTGLTVNFIPMEPQVRAN